MKSRLFLIFCLLALTGSATDLSFDLSKFGAYPTTNRTLTIQAQSPFVGANVFYTSDSNGLVTVSNVNATLYFCAIKAPPQNIQFKLRVDSTNAGLVDATYYLVADGTSTFPAGQVAWAAWASDQRYISTNVSKMNFSFSNHSATVGFNASTNFSISVDGTNAATISSNSMIVNVPLSTNRFGFITNTYVEQSSYTFYGDSGAVVPMAFGDGSANGIGGDLVVRGGNAVNTTPGGAGSRGGQLILMGGAGVQDPPENPFYAPAMITLGGSDDHQDDGDAGKVPADMLLKAGENVSDYGNAGGAELFLQRGILATTTTTKTTHLKGGKSETHGGDVVISGGDTYSLAGYGGNVYLTGGTGDTNGGVYVTNAPLFINRGSLNIVSNSSASVEGFTSSGDFQIIVRGTGLINRSAAGNTYLNGSAPNGPNFVGNYSNNGAPYTVIRPGDTNGTDGLQISTTAATFFLPVTINGSPVLTNLSGAFTNTSSFTNGVVGTIGTNIFNAAAITQLASGGSGISSNGGSGLNNTFTNASLNSPSLVGIFNANGNTISNLGGNGLNFTNSTTIIPGGTNTSLVVGSGNSSIATNIGSVAIGGEVGNTRNVAGGYGSFVAGGAANLATGQRSAVLGGTGNTAGAVDSVAMGAGATTTNGNTFIWSDGAATRKTGKTNQFIIYAAGGVGIGTTNTAANALAVSGTVDATGGFTSNGVPMLPTNSPPAEGCFIIYRTPTGPMWSTNFLWDGTNFTIKGATGSNFYTFNTNGVFTAYSNGIAAVTVSNGTVTAFNGMNISTNTRSFRWIDAAGNERGSLAFSGTSLTTSNGTGSTFDWVLNNGNFAARLNSATFATTTLGLGADGLSPTAGFKATASGILCNVWNGSAATNLTVLALTATNGVASYATNTLTIAATGITNTLAVAVVVADLKGNSIVQTNSSGFGFSRGTLSSGIDVVLQPGAKLMGSSITADAVYAW